MLSDSDRLMILGGFMLLLVIEATQPDQLARLSSTRVVIFSGLGVLGLTVGAVWSVVDSWKLRKSKD